MRAQASLIYPLIGKGKTPMTQEQARNILKLGKNVFLTGAPGAGKTYLLAQYIDFLRLNDVNPAITAYTGIAASHLNGKTLHSWAGLRPGPLRAFAQERDRVRNNQFLTAKIARAKVLIIDEISMLSPELFEQVDFICKTARNSMEPFGGLQLICSGDFFQIPPINQENGRFVLDSGIWEEAKMKICYLHEQHRQGDHKLLVILEEIRRGDVGADAIALLKSRVGAKIDAPIGVARLYTHNEDVDEINERELRKLTGPEIIYEVHSTGDAKVIEKLKKDYRIKNISLKKGARVMFTRNNEGMGYVNGTLGEIVDFDGDGDPVVMTFDQQRIAVAREQWDLEDNGETKASVWQVPLRLAWAITVHKSQGMTLDAAEIELSRAFEEGMGYVALSRVKRLENLSLIGWNDVALKVNDRIKRIDDEFLEQSIETENYLHGLGAERVDRLQREFVAAMKEEGEAPKVQAGAFHFEPDEVPVIDFEGYGSINAEDIPF